MWWEILSATFGLIILCWILGFSQSSYKQNNPIMGKSFNYDQYKKDQTEINKRKIDRVFEYEENIKMLTNYILSRKYPIKFGLCHGTRQGKEQEWFMKYFKELSQKTVEAKVLGTEISDTAKQFPNTIQWDFHEIKDEWVDKVDFIYSNSLDHSYDIEYCLKQWIKCLTIDGLCIINVGTGNNPTISFYSKSIAKADISPFTKQDLLKILTRITNIEVLDILKSKKKKWFYRTWDYIIFKKVKC